MHVRKDFFYFRNRKKKDFTFYVVFRPSLESPHSILVCDNTRRKFQKSERNESFHWTRAWMKKPLMSSWLDFAMLR